MNKWTSFSGRDRGLPLSGFANGSSRRSCMGGSWRRNDGRAHDRRADGPRSSAWRGLDVSLLSWEQRMCKNASFWARPRFEPGRWRSWGKEGRSYEVTYYRVTANRHHGGTSPVRRGARGRRGKRSPRFYLEWREGGDGPASPASRTGGRPPAGHRVRHDGVSA